MNKNLNLNVNNYSLCVVCMRDEKETQMFKNVSDEITKIYELLVQEENKYLGPTTFELCTRCVGNLQFILEFRRQCLNSIDQLQTKLGFNAVFVVKEEKLDVDEFVPELKVESVLEETSVIQKIGNVTKKRKRTGRPPTKKIKLENAPQHKCDECEETYSNITMLKYHVIAKHQNGYKCEKCSRAFLDKVKYDEHMKNEEMKASQTMFKCDSCPFEHNLRSSLIHHVKKYHDLSSIRVTCNECGRAFKKETFKNHFVLNHMEKANQCTNCNKKFALESELEEHVSRKHLQIKSETKPMETIKKEDKPRGTFCWICNQTGRDSRHFLRHFMKTKGGDFKCLVCDKVFQIFRAFADHLIEHRDYDQPRECLDCPVTIKNRAEYRDHVLQHKQNIDPKIKNVYVCDLCNSWHYLSRNSQAHFLVNHRGANRCKYCSKVIMNKNQYDEHMKMENSKNRPDRRFYCEYCTYSTLYKPVLSEHKRFHHELNNEKIICNECEKEFKTKKRFFSHFVNVHAEKKHQCTDCGLKFASPSAMRKHHRMIHLKKVDFVECKICEKEVRAESFKLHMKSVHIGEAQFKCKFCDMSFKVAGSLKRHQFTHTKTRPFNCNLCPTGYYSNEYLRLHFERNHGIVYTPADIRRICGKKTNSVLEQKSLENFGNSQF